MSCMVWLLFEYLGLHSMSLKHLCACTQLRQWCSPQALLARVSPPSYPAHRSRRTDLSGSLPHAAVLELPTDNQQFIKDVRFQDLSGSDDFLGHRLGGIPPLRDIGLTRVCTSECSSQGRLEGEEVDLHPDGTEWSETKRLITPNHWCAPVWRESSSWALSSSRDAGMGS